MHTRMFVTTGKELVLLAERADGWHSELKLIGHPTQCVAIDPLKPSRIYCGTFGDGLWLSTDGGGTWSPAGEGIAHGEVMSIAVSAAERVGDHGVVWAGTEPSAIYRSEDGGRSWRECPALAELPSAPTWSFPPRPWTSHVRWIAPDPAVPARVFAGIELGGVMRSLDGGLTWEDRKPGSQHDAHVLRTHPAAPGRVYEVAGGGFAESRDGGDTWVGFDPGLRHHYLWGLAIDSGDPETMVITAARGPGPAHNREDAEAFVYRRTAGKPWEPVDSGLPKPAGTRAFPMTAHPGQARTFFGVTHAGGLYRSVDAGVHWELVQIEWPTGYHMDADASPAIDVAAGD
jgi:photosystem II stability/assembly factor-like uncharacterized protein